MKTNVINLFSLPTLIAALNLMTVGRVTAQTFTTLYSFSAASANSSGLYTNNDGANPYAGLTLAGKNNTRYGTTSLGGSAGYGTVFAVNTDGSGYTNLHDFTGTPGDGATPWAGLNLSGKTLYGTTYYGGSSGDGTVFAINTDGTGFTNLHSFIGDTEGSYPNAGLILSGSTLYGTASREGSAGHGTVFAVSTDGSGFTNLHSFAGYPSDGDDPVAGLILSDNTLYGTTAYGGSSGSGTVFKVSTDTTGFTILHSFQQTQVVIVCPNGNCPCGYICTDIGLGFPVCVWSFTCTSFPPPNPPGCAGFCGER